MKKRLFFFVSLMALLFMPVGCSNEQPESSTGWAYSAQGTYYLDESTVPLTGWQSVEGNRYYFDPARGGTMVSGWLELPEGRYYFDTDGILQTGWLRDAEKVYYLHPDGRMAVGNVEIAGKSYHFTASGEPVLLVNLTYGLPDDYQPELVEVDGFEIAKVCAGDLLAMMGACRDAGHRCEINSAFRDREFQQMLWHNRYDQYIAQGYSAEEASELSAQFVMPPGHSEHQTGLAVDITGTQEMYSWLERHAPEYGFILRYPENETHWADVSYEPWHFRYVGRELAREL